MFFIFCYLDDIIIFSPDLEIRCIHLIEVLVNDLADLTKELKENIKLEIKRQEEYANKYWMEPPEFKKNDKVWINSLLIIKNSNKKLKPRKLGPFKVISKISSVSYKLDLPRNLRIHPVMIHVLELEPYCNEY